MARHVVAAVADLPAGARKLFEAEGRRIAVFNVGGEYFAINDRCPHGGASLCAGKLSGLVVAKEPGVYQWTRDGEIIRCPWHGWEFDLRTGRSQCDPRAMRVRLYDVHIEQGSRLAEELKAEIFSVQIENDYVVIDI